MKKHFIAKLPIIIIFFSIWISILLSILIFLNNSHVSKIDLDTPIQTSIPLEYNIEQIDYGNYTIGIKGYAFILGEDTEYFNTQLVLHDTTTDNNYLIKTSFQQRCDLTTLYNDGYNYDNSGFYARFFISSVEKKHKYIIYLLTYKKNQYNIINTGKELTIN